MSIDTNESASPQIPGIQMSFGIKRSLRDRAFQCRYTLESVSRAEHPRFMSKEEAAENKRDLLLVEEIAELAEESDVNASTKIEMIFDAIINHVWMW